MKLIPRKLKKVKPFRKCSGCKITTNTRTLNIRYQDFVRTYATSKYNAHRDNFWIYNTKGYDLCLGCQKKFLKKLNEI